MGERLLGKIYTKAEIDAMDEETIQAAKATMRGRKQQEVIVRAKEMALHRCSEGDPTGYRAYKLGSAHLFWPA